MNLEIWSGSECTVNRVGDRYFDQSARIGHDDRLEDMDRLAALGVTRVRFPVLFERVAPVSISDADFGWCDSRLERLRALGIKPIVGLVHHGSGPRYATIDSEGFADELATFAAVVAERYPWIDAYTPINEPLTTARFCGLYGHWYPHGHDTRTFLRLLMNESLATRAAMAAIRRIVPGAALIQTEDLGRTFSTPLLEYQSEYENHRRWLSLDLLTGRVDCRHPLRHHLERQGIAESELDALVAEPCSPDVVGINYYLTSDRFLDERIERYPQHTHGGNGKHRYADVEAVRVRGAGIAGHASVLRETWERYRLPIAITEVHVGCTREEQLRWLAEAWEATRAAQNDGIDVRALTVWAAFGSVDWSSLLTREQDHYEPGLHDIRAAVPRATALASMTRELAAGRAPSHPLLARPGWWHREARLSHPAHGPLRVRAPSLHERPILVIGDGAVGDGLSKIAELRGLGLRRVKNFDDAKSIVARGEPWAVVMEPISALPSPRANLNAGLDVAKSCVAHDIRLVLFSSDRVFDGSAEKPYVESDTATPRCTHGRVHHWLESAVGTVCAQTLIVRTGPLLDPTHPHCWLGRLMRLLASEQTAVIADDEIVSPTFLPDALHTMLDLLIDRESGVWHLANQGCTSRRELVTATARRTRLNEGSSESWSKYTPPRMRALRSERATLLPTLDAALDAYAAALRLLRPQQISAA